MRLSKEKVWVSGHKIRGCFVITRLNPSDCFNKPNHEINLRAAIEHAPLTQRPLSNVIFRMTKDERCMVVSANPPITHKFHRTMMERFRYRLILKEHE